MEIMLLKRIIILLTAINVGVWAILGILIGKMLARK